MAEAASAVIETTCCIAGGGPAGMMLGFLLARAGVDVVVLEKHGDFLRDFRGDTIHPSTLEVMQELGLYDAFLARPHDEARELAAFIGDERLVLADFTHLPTRAKFIAFMPQWDFLDFLADAGKAYPNFRLMMRAEATGLVEAGGVVRGVGVKTPDGPVEIRAALTVGADGRHSTLRPAAGLVVEASGVPMDVLWFHMPRRAEDPHESFGRFTAGAIMITIDRGEHFQCGLVIPKGGMDRVRAAGIEAFRARVAEMTPFLADRVGTLASFDDVKLLTVAMDRLGRWHKPGLLMIGDAAHAMSPVAGVGVNLAVQDAVAAARMLGPKLKAGTLVEADLAALQARREPAVTRTQRLQAFVQARVISTTLGATGPLAVPFPLRLLQWFPILRRIPARIIGMGFRPEHVEH